MSASGRRWLTCLLAAALVLPISVVAWQQTATPRDVPQPPPTGTAIIAGRVLTADATPAPIRRARVTLENGEYRSGWSATTDDNGRFLVAGLPAGRFAIRASKPAWLPAEHGAIRPGGEGVPIVVADGGRREDVVLTMYPGSVITGTVRDRTGQPMPGTSVSVSRFAYSARSGEQSLEAATTATCDDLGVYRFYGLMPGEYVVSALLRSVLPASMADLQRLTDEGVQRAIADARPASPSASSAPSAPTFVGYAPTYFPGTANASLAGRVRIGVSEERGGVDIRLEPVPTARVDAVVTLPDGGDAASVQLFLISNQPSRQGPGGMLTGRRDASGRFTFTGLTPDTYTLVARAAQGTNTATAPDPAAGRGRGGVAPLTLHATVDVAVDGRDVVVPVELQPGVIINGRLVFEGDNARVPQNISAAQIVLTALRLAPALTVAPVRVAADSSFRFVGVPFGAYSLSYTPGAVLDVWTLKSAMSKGQDVLDTMLTARSGEAIDDLVLTFTDRPAELAGTLQDASGRPAPAYHVVAFSADRAHWTPFSRRVRETRPDTNGTFTFKGLAAGDYFLAALSDIEPGAWRNPAVLADLVPAAARVTIREGVRTTQDLRIR